MAKSIFSKSVLGGINNNLSPDFRAAIAGTVDLKKQALKVLQRANRRAQNIEKAGLPSPALKALYAERGNAAGAGVYSKFSITGLDIENETDWAKIKDEVGKAIGFLNNPTSTATGARQYVRNVAKNYTAGNFESAKKLVDIATQPTITENGEINVFNYGKVLEDFAADVQNIQADLNATSEEIQQRIEQALYRLDVDIDNNGHYRAGAVDEFNNIFGDGSPRMK